MRIDFLLPSPSQSDWLARETERVNRIPESLTAQSARRKVFLSIERQTQVVKYELESLRQHVGFTTVAKTLGNEFVWWSLVATDIRDSEERVNGLLNALVQKRVLEKSDVLGIIRGWSSDVAKGFEMGEIADLVNFRVLSFIVDNAILRGMVALADKTPDEYKKPPLVTPPATP